jgi:glycosyltransferase involved in cell wall biosynthesis
MPTASVIMPCFNHARFLIDSVSSILCQSHADLELIIVDDCSSDNSWELIRNLANSNERIIAIRHEQNKGASTSRNDALRLATGDFIGFCDADDVWEPEKLNTQVKLLQSNPQYDVTYCDTLIIDENGGSTGKRFSDLFPHARAQSDRFFHELIRRNFINMQSVLMRAQCVGRTG